MSIRSFTAAVFVIAAGLIAPQAASALKFTPAPGSPITDSGAAISSSAVGDFNGDGADDIAFSSWSSGTTSQIKVKLSQGDGSFSDATGSGFTVNNAYLPVVRTADFDGDGELDLLNGYGRNWNLLLGAGDGQFSHTPDSSFTLPLALPNDRGVTDNHAVAVGDLDGDGDLDLVFGMFETGLDVAINDGDGNFSPQPITYLVPGIDRAANGFDGMFSPVIGDFNGDGKPDVAAALRQEVQPSSTPTGVYVASGDGAGGLTPDGHPPVFSDRQFFNSLSSLRLDPGSTDDVAATVADSLPDGTNFFTALGGANGLSVNPSALGSRNAGYGPYQQVTGDFDRDGRTDIAVGARGDHQVAVLLNLGDGGLIPSTGSPFDLPPIGSNNFLANGIYSGDFDGDGILDLAADSSHQSDENQARGIDVLLSRPNLVSQAEVSFGELTAGDSVSRELEFSNDGAVPAEIASTASLTGPDAGQFQLGPTSCTGQVEGGESCMQEVIFAPDSAGEWAATLHLPMANQNDVDIPLSGTGTPPPTPAGPARLRLKLTTARRVRPGRVLVARTRVTNTGETTARGVSLRTRVPRRLARAVKPVRIGSLAAGRTVTRKIRIRVRPRAKAGRKLRIKVTATARDVKPVRATRSARVR